MNVLFVCTANKLRSPTAETLFKTMDGIEARSAGTDQDCPQPLTPALVAWADVIELLRDKAWGRIELIRDSIAAG